jgi:type IV pilus assembly protein PilY1
LSTIDARYTGWLRSLIATGTGAEYTAGRPGVVFVGTNDGVLHAFNLDDWSNRGTTVPGSRELWGFVPPALFGKMASMLDTHQTGFDGSPQVKDVMLQGRIGYTPIYRTILVSAINGAHAYVALDVTFPERPVFLWQFSAPDVGNTIGNVGLTQVNINWPGIGEMVRAVAILPGGEGVASSSCTTGDRFSPEVGKTRAQYPLSNDRDVRCWTRRGRGLYVVDVATGQLIQQFGFEHFPSPLTGSVAVDNPGVATSSAAYVFDHDGVLWRLSMVSTDPGNWKVAPIYDMFMDPPAPKFSMPTYQVGRHPVFAPTLTRDQAGNLVIVAATGDVDSPFDNATNRVISLTEKRRALEDGEIAAEISLNWRIDLNPWEAVTGPLTLFQDTIYFASSEFKDSTDMCAVGEAKKWGVHAYRPVDASASPPRPAPRLKRTGANNADPLIESEIQAGRQLLLGLTVRQQPVCTSSSVTYNAVTQQTTANAAAGGGGYELVGMMSGGSSGGSAHASDSALGTLVHSQPQGINPVHTSKVTSWTSMFE